MELVITKDIKRADGGVRLQAGAVQNYPRPTWQSIANTAGMELEDFTKPVTAAAEALVEPSKLSGRKRGNK